MFVCCLSTDSYEVQKRRCPATAEVCESKKGDFNCLCLMSGPINKLWSLSLSCVIKHIGVSIYVTVLSYFNRMKLSCFLLFCLEGLNLSYFLFFCLACECNWWSSRCRFNEQLYLVITLHYPHAPNTRVQSYKDFYTFGEIYIHVFKYKTMCSHQIFKIIILGHLTLT